MAVQPLEKRKIVKKITKHPNRFQSDRFMRVGVSRLLHSVQTLIVRFMCVEILEKAQRS